MGSEDRWGGRPFGIWRNFNGKYSKILMIFPECFPLGLDCSKTGLHVALKMPGEQSWHQKLEVADRLGDIFGDRLPLRISTLQVTFSSQ